MIITRSGFFKRGYNLSAPPGGGYYPNKPSNYGLNGKITEIDFSQLIPFTPPYNQDCPIPGLPSWAAIYQDTGADPSHWSLLSDPTATQSPPGVWKAQWTAGVYPSTHGLGNIFTSPAFGTSGRVYASMVTKFDYVDQNDWHPISNKWVNIECNASQLLMQLKEGSYYRHVEELSFTNGSWWGDDNPVPGENHLGAQVSNIVVPINAWNQIELLIDIPLGIIKVWQNNVLTSSYTPPFVSNEINTFGFNAFRGGGGETLLHNIAWNYDHFYLAW